MEHRKTPVRRCAIYTRKSSEEGLEQDFNSLHAQREACEAFIKSQASEGWRLIRASDCLSPHAPDGDSVPVTIRHIDPSGNVPHERRRARREAETIRRPRS